MAQRMLLKLSAFTIGMVVTCGAVAAQKDPLGKQGGHPLANRRATLADLLDQPDWGAASPVSRSAERFHMPREAEEPPAGAGQSRNSAPATTAVRVEQMSPRPVPPDNTIRDLESAIAERNRIVDRVDLFDTIDRILREEKEFAKRSARLAQAMSRQKQVADQVDTLNHPGATLVSPAAKANAMQAWRLAQEATRAAQEEWQQQANILQPLYDRVRPESGPWLECYGRMRRAVSFDSRDPERHSKLGVLETAIRKRSDFYEGSVLAAVLQVYDGNAPLAEGHLRQACVGVAKYNLFGTQFANDACHAYLMLGRTDMVAEFIGMLRKLQPGQQTAVRCWLVGLSAMISCKDNEAGTYLNKSLAKMGVFSKDTIVPIEAAPLLGDAALFRLTANNETYRSTETAREILAKTRREWDAWQVLRARAALAAADEKWGDAVNLLGRCAEAGPPTLIEELKSQRDAYAEQRCWIRPRPALKSSQAP